MLAACVLEGNACPGNIFDYAHSIDADYYAKTKNSKYFYIKLIHGEGYGTLSYLTKYLTIPVRIGDVNDIPHVPKAVGALSSGGFFSDMVMN